MRRVLLLTLAVFALCISFCAPSKYSTAKHSNSYCILELCIAWDKPAPGLKEASTAVPGKKLYFDLSNRIRCKDIKWASAATDETGRNYLLIGFTGDGETKLSNLTQDYQGKYLVSLFEGEGREALKLEMQIGNMLIIGSYGGFTEQEVDRIVKHFSNK